MNNLLTTLNQNISGLRITVTYKSSGVVQNIFLLCLKVNGFYAI